MTEIKLCGLSRPRDIEAANVLCPDYVGFVFAPGSRRYVSREQAEALRRLLSPKIKAVGVFADEAPETVASLLEDGVIDLAQLHGREDEAYMRRLRTYSKKPLIQAFRIRDASDLKTILKSEADFVLLDSGAGSGSVFDWELVKSLERDYFLAGGLSPENAGEAVRCLHPFAVDVSSGIETGGKKDPEKMAAFIAAVRKGERL